MARPPGRHWERSPRPMARAQWIDYPGWYPPGVMRVSVENGVSVGLLRPREDGLATVESNAGVCVARRVAEAITRAFFVEDRAQHHAALEAYATPELLGDEWP